MAQNSSLSHFLTIVFSLFEGKYIFLKAIKCPKSMHLVLNGEKGGCWEDGRVRGLVEGRGWVRDVVEENGFHEVMAHF